MGEPITTQGGGGSHYEPLGSLPYCFTCSEKVSSRGIVRTPLGGTMISLERRKR